ncbi:MAG: cytochrome P450 [Acidimicrobiia bacterium]|nr:cytochrome P450 [Acidimicrobiia bacterium]
MTLADARTSTLDDLDIHSIARYEADGYPWAEWDLLRETAPCFWYERDDIAPFWAITRHADVKAVGSDAKRFVNGGGRLRLKSLDIDARYAAAHRAKVELYGWDPDEPDDMVFFDAPKHTDFRLLTARYFTPAQCRRMEGELAANARRLTKEFRDRLAAGETLDLVHEYSVALPLMTIGSLLGVDPGDWADIHRWTDALFDVDSMRFADPGEERRAMRKRLHREFHDYVATLIETKRRDPADDLATVVVNAEVGGAALTEQQLHGYLKLLIAAGNETTRNALSRGVLALADHPDQVELLHDDPDGLVPSAVDEIVRWTTPVIQFARTAVNDVELHGQTIRAGQHVGLWYGAANRDPRVFDRPYELDITRDPNEHLGFGHGAHFCLGANLAKWELRAALASLAETDVLERLEPAGEPIWLTDLHVGAYKEAPVRFRS